MSGIRHEVKGGLPGLHKPSSSTFELQLLIREGLVNSKRTSASCAAVGDQHAM